MPTDPRHCAECGDPFADDVDFRRLTCSTRCRVRRHRRREREELERLRAQLAALTAEEARP